MKGKDEKIWNAIDFSSIQKIQYCKSKCTLRFIIIFNKQSQKYEILSLQPIILNNKEITILDGLVQINQFDKLYFPCHKLKDISNFPTKPPCAVPHFYHIIYPTYQPTLNPEIPPHQPYCSLFSYRDPNKKHQNYTSFTKFFQYAFSNHDFYQKSLSSMERPLNFGEWSLAERESFKRYFLIFGYGRWRLIRDASKQSSNISMQSNINNITGCNSGNSLEDKTEEEMILYGNSFIETVISQLKGAEGKEVRDFLQNLIDHNQFDNRMGIDFNIQMWGGESFAQRAIQWGKRIQLLYIMQDNLLNFLSNDQLIGMRPAPWWTRRHDIDLLIGTYHWGYGNYQAMREDPNLSFSKLCKTDPYYIFPMAENITKRLKKLVQLISRVENEQYDFEGQTKPSEHSGFSYEEKQAIVDFICDFGLPIIQSDDINGKYDWQLFKNKVGFQINKVMQQQDHKVEKFINQILLECQKLIQEYQAIIGSRAQQKDKNIEANEFRVLKAKQLRLNEIDQTMNDLTYKTDDGDDFKIDIVQAFMIHKRVTMFNILRKFILNKQSAIFESSIDELEALLQKERDLDECKMPDIWSVGLHDRGLLNAVSEQGIKYLKNAKYQYEYGLYAVSANSKNLLKRVEFLCQYFKQMPNKKSSNSNSNNGEKAVLMKANLINLNQKLNQKMKINIETDEQGAIKYPIVITQSLKILNLGYIDPDRPEYHSHRNIFPIGFKSLRTHQSMYSLGGRADYICEILDGGDKPLFKVTPLEEPDKPIIRDSTSGCWLEIVRRIETLTNLRKGKVTVSGPDRYGLQEIPVMQLIQQMPNAEKCLKYVFR